MKPVQRNQLIKRSRGSERARVTIGASRRSGSMYSKAWFE